MGNQQSIMRYGFAQPSCPHETVTIELPPAQSVLEKANAGGGASAENCVHTLSLRDSRPSDAMYQQLVQLATLPEERAKLASKPPPAFDAAQCSIAVLQPLRRSRNSSIRHQHRRRAISTEAATRSRRAYLANCRLSPLFFRLP